MASKEWAKTIREEYGDPTPTPPNLNSTPTTLRISPSNGAGKPPKTHSSEDSEAPPLDDEWMVNCDRTGKKQQQLIWSMQETTGFGETTQLMLMVNEHGQSLENQQILRHLILSGLPNPLTVGKYWFLFLKGTLLSSFINFYSGFCRTLVYPIIYRVLYIPGGGGFFGHQQYCRLYFGDEFISPAGRKPNI